MAIERTFGAALNKALRGLEQAGAGWLSEHPAWSPDLAALVEEPDDDSLRTFLAPSDSRLWRLISLLRRGMAGDVIQRATGISPWFVSELERLIRLEHSLREAGSSFSDELLVGAKRACFGDRDIATLTGLSVADVRERLAAIGLRPGFAMVDTSAAEFAAETPYFLLDLCRGRVAGPGTARQLARLGGSSAPGPVRIG
jgi:carbamoyl-phosphate synthase large subunit